MEKIRAFVEGLDSATDYTAVFIPGGHGAMLGLPEDAFARLAVRAMRES
jgi:molecular chaperone Hsp31 and glyoxalase 3